jgi:hypothetical protein
MERQELIEELAYRLASNYYDASFQPDERDNHKNVFFGNALKKIGPGKASGDREVNRLPSKEGSIE